MSTTTATKGNTLTAGLLPELDHELEITRKCLERVPFAKFDWKPHPRSMSLGQLATFLAVLPSWITITIGQTSLDLGSPPQAPPAPSSAEGLLGLFDGNAAAARAALKSASDEHILQPWTLLQSGQTLLTQPRLAVLRFFAINHLIHHRGQLTVYLRMNDVSVPAIYGPSADEGHW
jgi:uncharacterized damage-inducible protein DinB